MQAVRGVSCSVMRGTSLAIVGESGCGTSVTVQSIMGLIPAPPGRITAGSAKLNGREILGLTSREANEFRGAEIGMIFQDPMTSLNPTMTIGDQIAETLVVHRGQSYDSAARTAVDRMQKTKMPEAARRVKQYPCEFSGGMLHRSMIAMSLACNPSILIADEPTTALDVTIQAQILELMLELQRTENMSIILITPGLAVVARMADEVCVMYDGQIVETGSVEQIFYQSAHPYTLGLREAMPSNRGDLTRRLRPIEGTPPDLFNPPKGCGYFARCPHAMKICKADQPAEFVVTKLPPHRASCWLQHSIAPRVSSLHQPHQSKDRLNG